MSRRGFYRLLAAIAVVGIVFVFVGGIWGHVLGAYGVTS